MSLPFVAAFIQFYVLFISCSLQTLRRFRIRLDKIELPDSPVQFILRVLLVPFPFHNSLSVPWFSGSLTFKLRGFLICSALNLEKSSTFLPFCCQLLQIEIRISRCRSIDSVRDNYCLSTCSSYGNILCSLLVALCLLLCM